MKEAKTLILLVLLVFSINSLLAQNSNILLNIPETSSTKIKVQASQTLSLKSSTITSTKFNYTLSQGLRNITDESTSISNDYGIEHWNLGLKLDYKYPKKISPDVWNIDINTALRLSNNKTYTNINALLSSVFGQGGEWNEDFADNALSQLNSLEPNIEWIAELEALPDNTWLETNSIGIPALASRHRSEAPMVYMPDFNIMFYTAGDGEEYGSYNSDSWAYSLNANTWVQMQPNYIKNYSDNQEPYPTDRPAGRCSFGLSYDTNRSKLVLRGGANAGSQGRATWEYDPAINRWEKTASINTGYNRAADNNLGFIPGFGTVEVGGNNSTTEAETWVYRPEANDWEQITTNGSPPGAHNSPLVWASNQERLIYWAGSTSELWSFDPITSAWEDISPEVAIPDTLHGFYRHGMVYDSTNDVIIMYGSKNYNNDVLSMGPWVYSFETNTWEDMNPTFRPSDRSGSGAQNQHMAYSPEHNVVVITGNGRGTWVYRYKTSNALSVEESLSDNFNLEVYPNPTSNIFTINLKNNFLKNVIVYNQLGQQVKEGTTNQIDVSNLPNGIYFAKITLQNGKEVTKEIIKN